MSFPPVSLDALRDLVGSGRLKLVYVLGIARSNSTLVAHLLGNQLDGVVLEPAMPRAFRLERHYAGTIIKAYGQARRVVPEDRPVTLVVKDLSQFPSAAMLDFIYASSAHIVFTVREPAAQHRSLVNQFAQEFGVLHRIKDLARHPVEVSIMSWYLLTLGARYARQAAEQLGWSWSRLHALAMAGWTIENWTTIGEQHASALTRLGVDRVTLLDASAMRREPSRAAQVLAAIADSVRSGPRAANPVHVAGHSRMTAGSRWASEALNSRSIKPLSTNVLPGAVAPFEPELSALLAGTYARLLDSPANGLVVEPAYRVRTVAAA